VPNYVVRLTFLGSRPETA